MRKVIDGDVNLRKLYLTELLDLSDVEVTGYFTCYDNDLTNLKGAPHTVGGSLSCGNNYLTSLQGAPKTVGGWFYCYDNDLTSLKGAPETVGGGFDCCYNDLTSLEGIPKTIGGSFYIDEALKDKFSEEYIRIMCKITGNVVYV